MKFSELPWDIQALIASITIVAVSGCIAIVIYGIYLLETLIRAFTKLDMTGFSVMNKHFISPKFGDVKKVPNTFDTRGLIPIRRRKK